MRSSIAFFVAALALAPVSAHAQGGEPGEIQSGEPAEIEVGSDREEDEGNSKLGLLGLLGLAGLLGLRRREPDIHIDAR